MIYLDSGATSFPKPSFVRRAVNRALEDCANPGRGGYPAAMAAARQVYQCRVEASRLFSCQPEQVVMTSSCTEGLNIAIRTLVKPGSRVAISGFEHNAVTRPLQGANARVLVAGRQLFSWDNTLQEWEKALDQGAEVGIFTHVSNVFGYILPVEEMAAMCRSRGIPFILDGAQSAGTLPVNMERLGADFIAMPGHKGLLGPQGTGLLLCGRKPLPFLLGGTGTQSRQQTMPQELPEALEAGTRNVPGIAGLGAGLAYLNRVGPETIYQQEHKQAVLCAQGLAQLGMEVFAGEHQAATVSFRPGMDCEEAAQRLADRGIALRAGLHCAPLAHESAGTLDTGTIRVSFGLGAGDSQRRALLRAVRDLLPKA